MRNVLTAFKQFLLGLRRPSRNANLKLLRDQNQSLSTFIIRDAVIQDLTALAALHVKTWRETYWTSVSAPRIEVRELQWKRQFQVSDGSWFCIVMENSRGEMIGFAKGNTYHHADLPEFSGELNKIYLLRTYQRLGLGRKLICEVARRFLSMGISNMVLFGSSENPSCSFFDALEGERLYDKNGKFHGGYCWRDLNRLVEICAIK